MPLITETLYDIFSIFLNINCLFIVDKVKYSEGKLKFVNHVVISRYASGFFIPGIGLVNQRG